MLALHAHSPAIIHRDLKSPNLLVDKHWRVKVRAEGGCVGAGEGGPAGHTGRQVAWQTSAFFAGIVLPCLIVVPSLPRLQVTDFGLGKIWEQEQGSMKSSSSPVNPRWLVRRWLAHCCRCLRAMQRNCNSMHVLKPTCLPPILACCLLPAGSCPSIRHQRS